METREASGRRVDGDFQGGGGRGGDVGSNRGIRPNGSGYEGAGRGGEKVGRSEASISFGKDRV